MTAVFSTSSPVASVALFDEDGTSLGSSSVNAPMAASGACLEALRDLLLGCGRDLKDVRLFVADTGPGSFTGIKVSVTLAKTLAFAVGAKTAGVSSFDLISREKVVVIPSRKGEWFVRTPGRDPIRTNETPGEPFSGYGPGIEKDEFPLASRVAGLLPTLTAQNPEALLPTYLAEPSISTPKKPYRGIAPGDGPA